jgi:hypothetical protein
MCDTVDEILEYMNVLNETVTCKKAAIVSIFFLYLMNSALSLTIYIMQYKKKEETIIRAL